MAGPESPKTVDPPCSFHHSRADRIRKHILEPMAVFLVSVSLWAVYRWYIFTYTEDFGSTLFNIGQIIMQPTIWLGPAVVYWLVFRRGEYSFFTMTRDRAAQVTLVAVLLVSLYYVFFEQLMYVAEAAAGTAVSSPAYVVLWTELTPFDFVLLSFTFFFVVGPVEELFNRGFLLGQFVKALPPWAAVLLSALFFAAGHWPINVIFYHMSPGEIFVMTFYYMGFGVFMGMFYLWSRNLLGAIVFHGFWDWVLSVYTYLYISQSDNAIFALWTLVIVEWTLVVVFLLFFFGLYKALWQEEWQDNWGWRLPSAPRPGRYPYVSDVTDSWGDPEVRGRIVQYYAKHRGLKERGRRFDVSGRYSSFGASSGSVGAIVVVMCLFTMGVSFAGAMNFDDYLSSEFGLDADQGPTGELMENSTVITANGAENSENQQTVSLPDGARMVSVSLTLTWEDEEDLYLRYENQPDSLGMSAVFPDGTNQSTSMSFSGRQTLNWKAEPSRGVKVEGDLEVTVIVGECGDQEATVGLGLVGFSDNGNDYTLRADYTYYEG